MDTHKKHWAKPVLIVIGRGEPEERVLATCKTMDVGNGSGQLEKACSATVTCFDSRDS